MANLLTSIAGIGGLILSIAAFISMRRMRRAEAQNKEADAYSSLITALQTSGNTVADLIEKLAQLPQLESELKTTQAIIETVRKELDWQSRRSTFFIDFARQNWNGANHLYKIVEMNGLSEQVQWKPSDKFPTGPLAEAR